MQDQILVVLEGTYALAPDHLQPNKAILLQPRLFVKGLILAQESLVLPTDCSVT